jgi:hypothetical protein
MKRSFEMLVRKLADRARILRFCDPGRVVKKGGQRCRVNPSSETALPSTQRFARL